MLDIRFVTHTVHSHRLYRRNIRNEFSKQQLLPSGKMTGSCSRPQQRLPRHILFSSRTAPASAVDCSPVETFQFRNVIRSQPDVYLPLRPSSASESRLARNQLSATEAACRSSRTLGGICQTLHASVPCICARGVSVPIQFARCRRLHGGIVRLDAFALQCREEG